VPISPDQLGQACLQIMPRSHFNLWQTNHVPKETEPTEQGYPKHHAQRMRIGAWPIVSLRTNRASARSPRRTKDPAVPGARRGHLDPFQLILPREEPNKQKVPSMRGIARRGLHDRDGLPFASRPPSTLSYGLSPACHTSGPFFLRGPPRPTRRTPGGDDASPSSQRPFALQDNCGCRTTRSPRCGSPNADDGSTSQRFDERIMVDLGPDALRRRRADLIGREGVGRLEDRQASPELDRGRDVGPGLGR
jgi:hypothetical protein